MGPELLISSNEIHAVSLTQVTVRYMSRIEILPFEATTGRIVPDLEHGR
jgi:hypothetical protein